MPTPIPMDFPANPTVGETYTNSFGTVYMWDGYAWVVQQIDPADEALNTLGSLLSQIRVILQDTDISAGEYRYSTSSIIMNLNQGMLEMFRVRPDIFLLNGFIVPRFSSSNLVATVPIEEQWVPTLVYYAVGMTQIRDDEGTQDTRASAFLTKFVSTMVTLA